jgi:hypothetical protein
VIAVTTGLHRPPGRSRSWLGVFTRPSFDELLVRLVDLRQDRAAGVGTTVCCGRPPAELLGDLEAVGLGALGVVRARLTLTMAQPYLSAISVQRRLTSS